MTDSYQRMLQAAARKVYEARVEHDRAKDEKAKADNRYEQTAKTVRDHEAQLCQSVGANINRRMWLVDHGIAVIAEYRDPTTTFVRVLEAEPQE